MNLLVRKIWGDCNGSVKKLYCRRFRRSSGSVIALLRNLDHCPFLLPVWNPLNKYSRQLFTWHDKWLFCLKKEIVCFFGSGKRVLRRFHHDVHVFPRNGESITDFSAICRTVSCVHAFIWFGRRFPRTVPF